MLLVNAVAILSEDRFLQRSMSFFLLSRPPFFFPSLLSDPPDRANSRMGLHTHIALLRQQPGYAKRESKDCESDCQCEDTYEEYVV